MHDRSGLQRRLLGYRHDTGDLLLLIPGFDNLREMYEDEIYKLREIV